MSHSFALRYAWKSLRGGGQRSFLAVACIAFGVLSLVALQLVATTLSEATVVAPRDKLGGDAIVHRPDRTVTAHDRAQLAELVDAGEIEAATWLAPNRTHTLLRAKGEGRVSFVRIVTGVEPAHYPVVGEIVLSDPPSGDLRHALRLGHAVVTRDLALARHLKVGNAITLAGISSRPVALRIGGVATSTPDRQGATVLYSLETAAKQFGHPEEAGSIEAIRPGGSQAETSRSVATHVARCVTQTGGSSGRSPPTPRSRACSAFCSKAPGSWAC